MLTTRLLSQGRGIKDQTGDNAENLGMRFARHYPSSVQADGHGGRSMLTK